MVKPVRVEHITPGMWEDDEPAATQRGRVAYADQVSAGIVRSGANFVTPHAAQPAAADSKPITPTKVTIMPAVDMPQTGAPLTRAQSNVTGTFVDRAKGFALTVSALGATLGGLGVIVAVAAWGVPLLSVAALAWFGSLFTGTWAIAYCIHILVSPEASGLIHVLRGWAWLDREQAHRHELERHANGLDSNRGRK